MLMRSLRFLNVAVLSILVGGAGLIYAQDEKPQEDHPAKQEEAKPQPKQDEMKPPRQDEAKPQKEQEKPQKNDDKRMQDESRQQGRQDMGRQDQNMQRQEHPGQPAEHNGQMEHPGQPMAQGHPAQGNQGRHIPDDQFRAHFGHDHHFRAQGVIVAGQPQFQYGGYSFQLVDAWPADWAYTDDCYIDYIDGEYFLFDLLHPGVRVAIFIVG
jgi:hypothetical protein